MIATAEQSKYTDWGQKIMKAEESENFKKAIPMADFIELAKIRMKEIDNRRKEEYECNNIA